MDIATIILTSALINGLFVLIIQSWIKNTFAKELETHKAQLQAEVAERSIKQTRTFDDQANAVATIYEKLLQLSTRSKQLSSAIGSNNYEQIKLCWTAYNQAKKEFAEYYYPKAIYINNNTGDIISQYIYKLDAMFKLTKDRTSVIFEPSNNPNVKKELEQVGISTDALDKNTAEILHLIYMDFQKLLGLEYKK